jgi:hypothetical protein
MFARSWLRCLTPLAAAVLAGCGDDPTGPNPEVSVSLTAFRPSSPTAKGHYELWIAFALLRAPVEGDDVVENVGTIELRHSAATPAGSFRISSSGAPVDLSGQPMNFEVVPGDVNAPVGGDGKILWQLAVDAFVTIEPDGPEDGDPNLPSLIAGSFLNGTAELSIDPPGASDAIEIDLSGAAGALHLATPTTSSSADESEGAWFATPGGGIASLALPELTVAKRWRYEAWATHATSGTASLGKFLTPSGADQDGAGPLGGAGYSFPGSDFPFSSPGIDLSSSIVFVTLEPPGDSDGSGPFFEILRASLDGAATGTLISMTALPGGVPAATVTIPL